MRLIPYIHYVVYGLEQSYIYTNFLRWNYDLSFLPRTICGCLRSFSWLETYWYKAVQRNIFSIFVFVEDGCVYLFCPWPDIPIIRNLISRNIKSISMRWTRTIFLKSYNRSKSGPIANSFRKKNVSQIYLSSTLMSTTSILVHYRFYALKAHFSGPAFRPHWPTW